MEGRLPSLPPIAHMGGSFPKLLPLPTIGDWGADKVIIPPPIYPFKLKSI